MSSKHFQVVKFFEKQTVQTTERKFVEELDVPQVIFCTKYPFKFNVLENMGFNDTFLLVQPTTYLENINIPDTTEVWENGTYSMDELSIGWMILYCECNLL